MDGLLRSMPGLRRRSEPRKRRSSLGFGATAALTLVLVACTGGAGASSSDEVARLDDGSGSPRASASPSASQDGEEALLAFTECMREHGVDMPDPQLGEGGGVVFEVPAGGDDGDVVGPDDEDFREADEACRHLLEGAGIGPGTGGELPEEIQEAMLAFAECMREQGIDMPDPGAGGLIGRVGGDDDIDPRSEAFQEAEEACREHLEAIPMPGASDGGEE